MINPFGASIEAGDRVLYGFDRILEDSIETLWALIEAQKAFDGFSNEVSWATAMKDITFLPISGCPSLKFSNAF
ncbi:hypothetical protein CDL15_Pgr016814 [Punica granatum]|uniref:Uncharacterized protein n=1 Tax=Punica granatum TaxID=22663 RepID=A0A218WX99_PUNGR|nr:hypothetical protein CDL15_Pgr016814 [Punica granatum]